MIFAGVTGFLWFAEIPDAWTLTGAAIVVGATLFIGIREARLGKTPTPSQPAIDLPAVPRS